MQTEQNQKPGEPDPMETPEISEQANEGDLNDSDNAENEDESTLQSEVSDEEKLKAESSEWQNKYLRLYAEFDNFKRRTSKERLELLQIAGKDVIADLLPVLDDFERAQKSIETAVDIVSVKEGVQLVHGKLKNILSQKGLKEMQTKGTDFNADIHDAITNIPAPSADLKGKIIDELEKGYTLNEKVIRFAKVIVGS